MGCRPRTPISSTVSFEVIGHSFRLSDEHVARVTAREGRPHGVTSLHPERLALVVVDMQRYFMEQPYAGACVVAQSIVPNVNRLASAVRSSGGLVIWLQMMADPPGEESWTALRERYRDEAAAARWENLQPGSRGFELWPDLQVADTDLRMVKNRYSAFIQGSSEMHDQLSRRDVDTLLVAGVATNACCESTARDAMMLNYRVVMVSDACAAATDEEHASALSNFYLFFGDVQSTDQTLGLLTAAD